jgi:hypothetical protein
LWAQTGHIDFATPPTKVEIDWDDGTWTTVYFYQGTSGDSLYHTYDTGGLRHIKMYATDDNGDHCAEGHPVVFDYWVQ